MSEEPIQAVLVDYAGVLTNPLPEIYAAFSRACGLSMAEIALVMTRAAIEYGSPPLEALETATISERQFLDLINAAVEQECTKEVDLSDFRRMWFSGIQINVEFTNYVASLRGRGCRLALVTNNVREWRDEWAPMAPLEQFELVVDSSQEGARKPEPLIYERTLGALDLPAGACLFVDDVWEHCVTARRMGMPTVWFQSNRQAIFEINRELGRCPVPATP